MDITVEMALSQIERQSPVGRRRPNNIPEVIQPLNTALLRDYLRTDIQENTYNKADKRFYYITEMWGYPDCNHFEKVLHLFKENGENIYWLCRFTDPLMRAAQQFAEEGCILKHDCITMLESAKSTAQFFVTEDYAEKVQWINTNILQLFLQQGRIMIYFFDLYQGLDDQGLDDQGLDDQGLANEHPVSVYFQSACRIIILFIDQKWQEIIDLVDDIIY